MSLEPKHSPFPVTSLDYLAAIQELFNFLGIRTKHPGPNEKHFINYKTITIVTHGNTNGSGYFAANTALPLPFLAKK